MFSGLLMGAGMAIYPNGWSSSEIQQSCGFTSSPYNLGENIYGYKALTRTRARTHARTYARARTQTYI